MKAKLLLQDLCWKKLGWDTAVRDQDRIQWFCWLEDLPKLENLQVDPCFKPKNFAAVRRTLKKCLHCQKRKAPTGEQFMAKLSEDRVTPHELPFTSVGVDYFGPIEVKQGRSQVKRWGCLFTCLTVHVIHVEVAHSLNTNSMINALRRFINFRGCPKEIPSDCGSNFTKADKELKDAVDEWNQQKISGFSTQRGIE